MNVGEYTLNQFMNINFDEGYSAKLKVGMFKSMLIRNAIHMYDGVAYKGAAMLNVGNFFVSKYHQKNELFSGDMSEVSYCNVYAAKFIGDLKKHLANEAMLSSNGNAVEAAKKMGIDRYTLPSWLQQSVTKWVEHYKWGDGKEEWLRIHSKIKSATDCARELNIPVYDVSNKLRQLGIKARKHKDWWVR